MLRQARLPSRFSLEARTSAGSEDAPCVNDSSILMVFWWKIEKALHHRNGPYFMDRRLGGCFECDVEIMRRQK
jgi:hypothetical protein